MSYQEKFGDLPTEPTAIPKTNNNSIFGNEIPTK